MTTTTTKTTTSGPYVLNQDEGAHHHFLNHLATTKVESAMAGSMGAVQFLAPRGFGPPVHVHDDEDELIVVLEGEIAFRSGDSETTASAGGCAFLPHGVAHGFEVLSEQARFLAVTASATGTPRFDAFVAAVGTPTDAPTMPEEGPIDPVQLAEVSAAHGIAIVGPPPGLPS